MILSFLKALVCWINSLYTKLLVVLSPPIAEVRSITNNKSGFSLTTYSGETDYLCIGGSIVTSPDLNSKTSFTILKREWFHDKPATADECPS